MLSRERVAAVIEHQKPDRIPIYAWVSANLSEPITERFGSVAALEDQYEFDFAHLFGGPGPYPQAALEGLSASLGGPIEPRALMSIELSDPNDSATYADIAAGIQHHQAERGRFVYVQTPGIFECLNGVFGIENHLAYLALYPDDLREVYLRQAEWNRAFALNCVELGVDMVHVSDDWGAQAGLMFSPRTWWELIFPAHRIVCDAVKAAGAYLSVHSDGNVNAVIDGIIELGYNVVHPWQESAGMSLADFKRDYAGVLTAMGGLDVQTTIGFGRLDFLRAEIERVMRLFADGGLLFCTTHFVQDHCTMDELVIALDTAYELSRSVVAG
jgi:uroporphyrinogen decarboxylase